MKKINTSKSLVFGSKVEDVKNSLEYLDQEGYFSNSKDFSEYKEAELDIVRVSNFANFVFNPYTYISDGFRYSFSYFIPKSKVVFVEEEPKKKTLRPFKSIDEFFEVTGFWIGCVVKIKNFAGCTFEETTLITGFRYYTDNEFHRMYVIFGECARPLSDLFMHYKYYKNGEWLSFGVEE